MWRNCTKKNIFIIYLNFIFHSFKSTDVVFFIQLQKFQIKQNEAQVFFKSEKKKFLIYSNLLRVIRVSITFFFSIAFENILYLILRVKNIKQFILSHSYQKKSIFICMNLFSDLSNCEIIFKWKIFHSKTFLIYVSIFY